MEKAKITKKRKPKRVFPEPVIIPRSEHCISRGDISEHALKVLYRLHKNGFQGYLVGGGVRDLLLGLHPKDFDVVTNATPEEVRRIFSNCRIIGRRFRLAHVFFGRHIIEVATFRGAAEGSEAASGMILRDNVYGTLEEDAWRRDFTINALYYNIADFSVVDYTGGINDLNDKVLRIIGEPTVRLREDPVRLLRAIRFAAKLNLKILPDLESAMIGAIPLLSEVSSARLFEEVLKMFQGGAATRVYEWLQKMGLFKVFFIEPKNPVEKKLIKRLMVTVDQNAKMGANLAADFFIGAILWYSLNEKIERFLDSGESEFTARFKAMNAVLALQAKKLNLPKRLTLMIKELWTTEFKLEKVQGKRAARLFCDYRFKSSYDLLVLRAQAGEPILESVSWWTQYMESTNQQRKGLTKAAEEVFEEEYEDSAPTSMQEPSASISLEAESPFSEGFYFE